MWKLRVLAYGLAVLVGVWTIETTIPRAEAKKDKKDKKQEKRDLSLGLLDNCDPITFNAALGPGACVLEEGDTTFPEFLALLFSPLIPTVVGHPAWRFEPSYLSIEARQTLRVTNDGGEGHTFTEVVNFGGGSIPVLNGVPAPSGITPFNPLIRAPECPANPANLVVVAPGASVRFNGLTNGLHKFQCCIHPWMRAVIDVE